MTEISRAQLFGKLNETGYKSIESATKLCKLRGNPYVELVHWVDQIANQQDSDLHHVLRHFEIDLSGVIAKIGAGESFAPKHIFGGNRVSRQGPVRLELSRLRGNDIGDANLRYWAMGGFASRLWGYRYRPEVPTRSMSSTARGPRWR